MTRNKDIFQNIFKEEDCRITSLGSNTAKLARDPPSVSYFRHTGYLCITYNFPPVKCFINANSDKQRATYSKVWNECKTVFEISPENKFIFEFTKCGKIHLHGWIKIRSDKQYHIIGAIGDYVKRYLSFMPKKYRDFREAYMYYDFQRYKSPCICVQYKDNIEQWEEYMNKDQPKEDIGRFNADALAEEYEEQIIDKY